MGGPLPLTITMNLNIFIALIMRFIVMVNVMDRLPACKMTEVRMETIVSFGVA